MSEERRRKRDWVDVVLKLLTPVLAGLLIAWAGFIGNMMLSNQESARLITELQISREQSESELRKDVFDQALEAFFLKKDDRSGTLNDLSKQLLRLELLALNFGDSLSLSPLFIEFKKDLDEARPVSGEEIDHYQSRKNKLKKRLVSLAKRVAGAQLSSLSQHGVTKEIEIPLYQYKELSKEEGGLSCTKILFEGRDFAWPDFKILSQLGKLDRNYQPVEEYQVSTNINAFMSSPDFTELVREKSKIELDGVARYLRINISNVNHSDLTAKLQIMLVKNDLNNPEVNESFTLDYFNFPMVDNTRLPENQRLAIILKDFHLDGDNPHLTITSVIFPSEYASLRDRPGMQEARKLLESALKNEDE
ncbi:MAG: hypothetical protein DRQ52_09630 [Gammaproteobacteria bacterium]|nr:MAG: hypothetical protein DRQ52_09630 [Gammaproteobacteria bacterium]